MTKIIGIDVYSAMHCPRGMGNYTINILKELAKIDKETKFILYADIEDNENILPKQENFTYTKLKAKGLFHYEQMVLPKQCIKDEIDILFSPANTSPIFLNKKIKRILALHDLIFLKKDVPISKHKMQILGRIYYIITSLNAKKATIILAPTKYSKQDIIKTLNINANKIIIDSRGHEHFEIEKATDVDLLKQKYNIPETYFFHVGGDAPSKNTEMLLKCFSEYSDYNIVIAGIKKLEVSHLYKKYKNYENIIFVPYISQEDLVGLYKNAEAFIFPSLYEGFGLPLLEAMKCDCPILCSNATCLPEVAGDAAIYFNPKNEKDLIEKVVYLKFNDNRKKLLIKNGKNQLQKYSWVNTAKKILEVVNLG